MGDFGAHKAQQAAALEAENAYLREELERVRGHAAEERTARGVAEAQVYSLRAEVDRLTKKIRAMALSDLAAHDAETMD